MNVFLLCPDRDAPAENGLPFDSQEVMDDLAMNALFNAMAGEDSFLFDVARQTLLSSLEEPQGILYRQAILKDCLQHPEVIRQLYSVPLQAVENKDNLWMGVINHYPSSILSGGLEMLVMYTGLLKSLKQIADQHAEDFESQGLQRFFQMVRQELDDAYFTEVEMHIKTLKFDRGVFVSAELGPGNEGVNYTLRRSNREREGWMNRAFAHKSPSYTHILHPKDDYGARALADIRDQGINPVANAVAQSADHIEQFFTVLRRELGFYIGCLNLADQMRQLGEPLVFPQPVPAGERLLSCTGLYDICLALTTRQKVIGNDVRAEGQALVIITGANQGGKSTFLRSIGLGQIMMQCGMFVPAEAFSANLCTGLHTHYKREEDPTMTSGKFDEELGRMSAIVDHLLPNSILLFDESFAATNEREGSEIARQIVTALLEKQVKIFFVTHLVELACGFHQQQAPGILFLRAERGEDGSRNFKLVEGAPLQTGYGMDLYGRIFAEAGSSSAGQVERLQT
jgi:DNA mismatch repair ATPase MutS